MPSNFGPDIFGSPVHPGSGSGSAANQPVLNGGLLGQNAAVGTDGGQNTRPNIGIQSDPPSQKTLVYSPDVRVIIAHGTTQYDVSEDIVRCSLHRAEDTAATFFMTLSNKGQRYTPPQGASPFWRMDRIIVFMKRTNMIQVFSGYLDVIPYVQTYPGTVDFRATCTIKRLKYTWWNPALTDSATLLDQKITAGLGGDGSGQNKLTDNGNDNGLGGLIRQLLTVVGGWKAENIHIQNFPETFYQYLRDQSKKRDGPNQDAVEKFKRMLLGADTSPGVGSAAGGSPNAGTPGPQIGGPAAIASGGTLAYVQQIIIACDERGLGPIASDNNNAASLVQAATIGEQSTDSTQVKAWQQVQKGGAAAQNVNRQSDAAILGVATAAVETGGGISIHNWGNPACPGSESLGEGLPKYGVDLDSCGIFQQRNSGWGTVAQRMNPKQAASMFFEALTRKVPDWRNQDPGAACQAVQQSAFPAKYSAAIQWATEQVKAVRTGQGGVGAIGNAAAAAGSAIPSPSLGGASAAPAPSSNPSLTTGVASVTPDASGGASGAPPVGLSSATGLKPNPDSEGAVQFALSKCGNTPYIWGAQGPNGYDCSGLVRAAFASIGVKITGNTDGMRAGGCPQIPKSEAGRGDIYQPESGHVTILLSKPGPGGSVVSARTSGVPLPQQIAVQPWYTEGGEWYGRGCLNGGPDPTSPYNMMATGASNGTPPGALDQTTGASGGVGSNAGSQQEQIARNLFSYMFGQQFNAETATMWPTEKAFLDGQPLLQIVKAVSNASLRKFQSGPNGDLMFYYPDWWGLDGKPAVYRMEDIELKDVRIDYSDDPLTTHVYIAGDLTQMGQIEQPMGWMATAGTVTVEDAWIYERLTKIGVGTPEGHLTGDQLLHRFGVRPLKQEYALAGSHELEILLAAHVFMEKWSQQFQTNISLTFMPELYPGMRIELANHGLSVYVTEVTHICDRTQGFTTEATITSPARPNALAAMDQVKTGDTGAKNLGDPGYSLREGLASPMGSGSGVSDPGIGPIK